MQPLLWVCLLVCFDKAVLTSVYGQKNVDSSDLSKHEWAECFKNEWDVMENNYRLNATIYIPIG